MKALFSSAVTSPVKKINFKGIGSVMPTTQLEES